MLMKTNNIFYRQAARYLAGEMTPGEQRVFESSCQTGANHNLFFKLKHDWNTIAMHSEKEKINTDRAWSHLMGRLESEQLVGKQMQGRTQFFQPLWLRVAAAILLLAAIGSLWLLLPNVPSGSMVTISTGSEGAVLFQNLPDGSKVFLGPGSTLTFPKNFKGSERLVRLSGNGFFDIKPNPRLPFRIDCSGKMVEVLGTSFKLSAGPGTFEIMVETGNVRVFDTDNPSDEHIVASGEQMVMVNSGFVKSRFDKGSALQQTLNRIQFKDTPLGSIVEVLNQKFNRQVVFSSPEMANRKLTATFEGNSLDTIVEVICRSLNWDTATTENTIVLRERVK